MAGGKLIVVGVVGLVGANVLAASSSDPFIGIAAIVSALAAGAATVIGALNRRTVKDTNRTAARVESTADEIGHKADVVIGRVDAAHSELSGQLGRHLERVEGTYSRLADIQTEGLAYLRERDKERKEKGT